MKNFIATLNIKKLVTLLLLAVSAAVVVLLVTQKSFVAELVQRGPKVAFAQTDDYGFSTDNNVYSSDDYTFTPDNGCSGSCWNYVPEEASAAPAPQVAPEPVAPAAPSRHITYEGGDCVGNHSYWVKIWSDGQRELVKDHGVVPGECGNTVEQPAPAVTWTRDQYGECDWSTHTVWDVEVSSTGERRRTNIARTNAPECGYKAPQAPQPAPVVQQQQQQQQQHGQPQIIERYVDNSVVSGSYNTNINNSFNRDSAIQSPNAIVDSNVTYAQPVTQVAPVVCPDGYTRQVSGSSVTCIPPVVNNSTVRVVTAEVNCPEGYTRTTNGSQVTCTAPAPRVVTVAGGQEVKELPKTGLPIAAWALMGLLPAGAKLRKFGSEKEDLITAASLWEERQFKRA